MALEFKDHLPDLGRVLDSYPPLPAAHMQQSRRAVQAILAGEDPRMLVIQGPCSYYPIEAGLKHAQAMQQLQDELKDEVQLVERVYIQKPRTRGGWAGIQIQPDPNGPIDAGRGIWVSRVAMKDAARELPIGDEILFPENGKYFNDLLSYGAIGARNVESMYHRWVASGMDFPVGMKNSRSGNVASAVDAIAVAQQPNMLTMHDALWQTSGNPYAHLVLRGGQSGTNYDEQSVYNANRMLTDAKVQNPAIVIDASHDNAVELGSTKKTPERQIAVARQVVRDKFWNPGVFGNVRGLMLESFLKQGNQPVSETMDMDGLSITDPCIGLEQSKELLYEIADAVRKSRKVHV